MAFSVPTLNDLVRTSENGMMSAFGIEVSSLRKGVLKILARVWAGIAYLLILFLSKMWKNFFIFSADVESLKECQGVDLGLPPKPAGYALGAVVVKSESSSAVLPQGTIFVDDDGNEYETVLDTTLSGGASGTDVKVLAVDFGSASNHESGCELTFRDGTPQYIDDVAVVGDGGIKGGSDIEVVVNGTVDHWGETVEDYRARLINYRQNPPVGGNSADYKNWAERFNFVSKCIVDPDYPHAGAVTLVLANYNDNDITLNQYQVNEVRDYIDQRRFVTADVQIYSCASKSVPLSIGISPNTPSAKESVLKSLKMALKKYVPGDNVAAGELESELRSSADVESVKVYSVGTGSSIQLSRANHELPVTGPISWSSYV